MDLPAREETLTFLELRRFCKVCYDHIMLRSSNLADPTTVLPLDRKAPDDSRLCWGAPLFESDVEAVTTFLPDFEGDPRREFLPVCRAGRKEAVRAIVHFFVHFKYYEKVSGSRPFYSLFSAIQYWHEQTTSVWLVQRPVHSRKDWPEGPSCYQDLAHFERTYRIPAKTNIRSESVHFIPVIPVARQKSCIIALAFEASCQTDPTKTEEGKEEEKKEVLGKRQHAY